MRHSLGDRKGSPASSEERTPEIPSNQDSWDPVLRPSPFHSQVVAPWAAAVDNDTPFYLSGRTWEKTRKKEVLS